MAQTRRRKKTSGDPPRLEKYPLAGTFCGGDGPVPCGEPQYKTPSGLVCKFGHGGASELDKPPTGDWVSGDDELLDLDTKKAAANGVRDDLSSPWERGEQTIVETAERSEKMERERDEAARDIGKRPDVPFEVREGDRLSVNYNGAKLQIVQFSNVELDGGFYSRTLVPGDDPVAEWDRIYGYLRDQSLKGAREKLATFSDELAKARARAKG